MDGQVSVAAEPEDFAFDPATTAVVVVDMQNDFGAEGGMFARSGIPVGAIAALVPRIARVLDAARAAGMPVVFLKMGFRADLSDAPPASPTWRKHLPLKAGEAVTAPDGSPSRILVRDTWNTEIVPALAPRPGDHAVWKARYSGFAGTGLDDLLRSLGVRALVIVGATTSICVEATLRDATHRDYPCLLLEDCVAEPIAADAPRSNHEATLLAVRLLYGWTATSDALVAALVPVAA